MNREAVLKEYKKRKRTPLITVCFLIAIVLVLYPFIANQYNDYIADLRTAEQAEVVADTDPAVLKQEWKKARTYNEGMTSYTDAVDKYFGDMTQTERYESCLNLNNDGIMGSIEIPKINVNLPIYHYTTDRVLQVGIGHMSNTSLPVGGESTNCVLTGHSGLIGNTLFT